MSVPRIAEWLLSRAVHPHDRDAVLGDLVEEFSIVRQAQGSTQADMWYWGQVLRSVIPALVRRAFGSNVPRMIHHGREGPMGSLGQDLRFAMRTVRHNLAFALLSIGTLGLGIGATTIVYSTVNGLVLNPFPFPDPRSLVGIGPEFPKLNQPLGFLEVLSPAEFVDIREQSRTLTDVVAWDLGNRTIGGTEEPERVFTAFWWGNAFATLRVAPALGRGFLKEELDKGAAVAVISHRLWTRRFGGDSSVVGTTMSMNDQPYTIVGVMPPRTLIYGTDLWIPMGGDPAQGPRNARQFEILARIAPGATLEQANAELATIARRTEQTHGAEFEEYAGWRLVAMTWNEINVRMLRPAAYLLMGSVGFVLLLVCANMASLTLARGTGRRREMAVRAALGANRRRLVRQLLTESLLLSLAGGVLGIVLAYWGVGTLAALLPALPLSVPGEIAVDGRVLGFAMVTSVLAGILYGVVPALHASRSDVAGALKAEAAATTASGRRHRMQRVLVGLEVALALVLLTGGGLLLNSFVRLQRVDPGFDTRNVLTMRLTLPRDRYDGAAIGTFFESLAERVEGLPGVTSVGFGSAFAPGGFAPGRFAIAGRPATDEGTLPTASFTLASDAYFSTLGVPLRSGRVPGATDTESSPLVLVVNETLARRYFPGEDPVGRRITIGGSPREAEIVGVVGAVKNRGLDRESEPEIFGNVRQMPGANNQLFLLVRTAGAPHSLTPLVRAEVRALDAKQPIYAVRTVEEAFAAGTTTRRVATVALTGFACFALLLAALGIYGVVSYAVSERTREIGVRMALGAQGLDVRRMVVRQAMVPVVLGTVAGLAGAIALGRVMRRMLFEIGGSDPLTIGVVASLLILVALVASWLPALRASRLDPVIAMRTD